MLPRQEVKDLFLSGSLHENWILWEDARRQEQRSADQRSETCAFVKGEDL